MGSDAISASRPIGVFDSGVGGLSILRALRAELPAENFVYLADAGFAPYGERDDAFVAERARAVAQRLLDEHAIKALVIACNTATAAAVHVLRAQLPGLPIVGVEPALKPALALTRTGRIGVLATRATLASAKFAALQAALQGQAQFVLQACDGLADAIETNDGPRIAELCAQYTGALGRLGADSGAIDTLVLGCTHYPFAQPQLQQLAGADVHLVETGQPVARQTRRLLESAGLRAPAGAGALRLESTGELAALERAAARWL
ncbi:glutamate racemase [Caenimonas terrae]|uniref:Glutamate racemase n=1 Tax=Caenimonas terrae TaxID=696074 RepID=A0ABW0NBV1_9BURK